MHEYVTELLLKNAEYTLDDGLLRLRDEYRAKGVPTLLTESLNELILIAKIKNPKNILEFGTATGCSGIALLLACPKARLTTIEKFKKSADEAAKNFERFGVSGRVKQIIGDQRGSPIRSPIFIVKLWFAGSVKISSDVKLPTANSLMSLEPYTQSFARIDSLITIEPVVRTPLAAASIDLPRTVLMIVRSVLNLSESMKYLLPATLL